MHEVRLARPSLRAAARRATPADSRPAARSLLAPPCLQYRSDFYSHEILVVVLGYIRPELNYISKGASRARGHASSPSEQPD